MTTADHESVFLPYYERGDWPHRSMWGSTLELTKGYRALLERFIVEHGVRSVLDVGCGDWTFSQAIDWHGARYVGLDVIPAVVERNRRLFPGFDFVLDDALGLDERYAGFDLVLVKDVLQHWSNETIHAFLARPVLRTFRHVLLTNCDDEQRGVNPDIADGGWRPLNLLAPPFSLPGTCAVARFGTKRVVHLGSGSFWRAEVGAGEGEVPRAATVSASARPAPADDRELDETCSREVMARAASSLPAPPFEWSGEGIVIPGGGRLYFTNAWVCVNMLRRVGCRLPIQLWHLGQAEMTSSMRALIEPLGVECVDALAVRETYPIRRLEGYELKAYALYYSRFRHTLLIDADNMALEDPSFLFESEPYRASGAIFWPDLGSESPLPTGRLDAHHPIWRVTGLEYEGEPEFESGQICVDKARCARELAMSLWMNENSYFFYRYSHGDKETWHIAWRFLGRPYAMVPHRPGVLAAPGTGTALGQHDFSGRTLFQHRTGPTKWSLDRPRVAVRGFVEEDACAEHVEELRRRWG